MSRFACLAAAAVLAACTDATPYMAISDAPGAISLQRDPVADWSMSGGATGFFAAGDATFPQLVTLRVEARRADDDYETNDPLSAATLAVVEGSACRLTAALTCMGGICFAEVELTQAGLCVVRADGATRDDTPVESCWFRGTWQQDPVDPTFADRMTEMANRAYEACLASSSP